MKSIKNLDNLSNIVSKFKDELESLDTVDDNNGELSYGYDIGVSTYFDIRRYHEGEGFRNKGEQDYKILYVRSKIKISTKEMSSIDVMKTIKSLTGDIFMMMHLNSEEFTMDFEQIDRSGDAIVCNVVLVLRIPKN